MAVRAEPPMRYRALKRQPPSIFGTSTMPTLSAASRGVAGLLFVALVANAAGHSFVLVVMPGLARRLGFSDLQTGLMIGLSALVVTLTAPAWGRVGDRAGRRRPFIAALVGGAVFLGFAAFLVSLRLRQGIDARTAFILLFAARVLQSCLAGGLVPATQAIVADITAADRRAGGLGVMGAAFGIGSILGGVIAWRLAADAPVPALALLAAVIAVAAAVSAVLLPETRDGASVASGTGIGLARTIFRYLAVTLFSTATYATMQQVTVLRLEDGFRLAHDVAMRTGSAVMMTSMAAMVLGLLFLVPAFLAAAKALSERAAAGAAACLLAAAVTTALPVLFAAMAGFGLFLSLLTPANAAQISLCAPGAQASAGGINAVAKGLGMAVGPIAGAGLHQISPRAPYIAAALALLCCAAMIWPASELRADRPARSGGQPQVE
jgi:MFS family permease